MRKNEVRLGGWLNSKTVEYYDSVYHSEMAVSIWLDHQRDIDITDIDAESVEAYDMADEWLGKRGWVRVVTSSSIDATNMASLIGIKRWLLKEHAEYGPPETITLTLRFIGGRSYWGDIPFDDFMDASRWVTLAKMMIPLERYIEYGEAGEDE